MRNRVAHKLSFSRTALLTLAATAALAGPIVMGVVSAKTAGPESAATPQNSANAAFDVASVKLFVPNVSQPRPGMFMNFGPPCGFTGLQIDPTRIAITAYPYTLISIAYGKPGSNCRTADLLTGGPEWIRSERYDIEATFPAGSTSYTLSQFAGRDAPGIQMMLQTLLADRFKLKVHKETKDVSSYVLTGKGAKLTAWKEGEPTARRITPRRDTDGQQFVEFVAGNASMVDLANMLGGVVSGTVLDQTGITGKFNVTLEFDSNGVARPTVATVLQELGLKLETTKVPMEVLVIDSVEKPTEN